MTDTKQQVKAAMVAVQAIGEVIQELGSVPSGHLYARLMGSMSLETYNMLIKILKDAGVVKESGYLLTWVGPAKKTEGAKV